MAKTKQATYNFSPAQCVHLETLLPQYVDYLKDDDADGCDQTIAEAAAIICTEAGIKDEAKKESVTTSVRQWLTIKASNEKKSRVVKPFEVTGKQSFHTAQWESTIKPEVLKLKKFQCPHPNKHSDWLKEIMITRDALWSGLTDVQRKVYEVQALEFNEGTVAKEIKALYGDKHFEEELQKVLNRFGDLFDARIIAVTVRPGTEGVMSSILESKGTSKFLKTLPESKRYQWKPAEYVAKMQEELGVAEGNDSDDPTLRMKYDGNRRPILPRGPYDRQTETLRTLLADLVRENYNRVMGYPKTVVGPPWTRMTGHWSQYIDPKFFPSQSSLPDDFDLETLVLQRPQKMPIAFILQWADHVVERQDKKDRGELEEGEEVFSWKVYWSLKKGKWVPEGTPNQADEDHKKRRRKRKRAERQEVQEEEEEVEDEITNGLAQLDSPVDFGPADNDEEPDVLHSKADASGSHGKGKETIRPGSPASVGDIWSDRVTFLRQLCDDMNYRKLVNWLDTFQTDTQLRDETIPRAFPVLGPIGWENPFPYLPPSVHTAVNGSTMMESLLRLWETHNQTLWGVDGSVEELLLISGQLIRDIRTAQFAQRDAEEPWPAHLPYYLSHTNFSIETENRISSVCLTIWNTICYTAQMELFGAMHLGADLLGPSGQTPSGSNARAILGIDEIQPPLGGPVPNASMVAPTNAAPSAPVSAVRPIFPPSSHPTSNPSAISSVHTSNPALEIPDQVQKKGKSIKPRQPPRKKSKKTDAGTSTIQDPGTLGASEHPTPRPNASGQDTPGQQPSGHPAVGASQRIGSGQNASGHTASEPTAEAALAGQHLSTQSGHNVYGPAASGQASSQHPSATSTDAPDDSHARTLRAKQKMIWRKDGSRVPEDQASESSNKGTKRTTKPKAKKSAK
ncbi:hypothetical protein QCA50_003722 [Cerrena zonata]|uniref:Uncharacterized protein n=1 Tax=Cerrena zonata TaxID=2478898 RepID=A0AAW0FAP1_9APHY